PVPPGNGCIAERTTFNNSVNREEVTQFKMPDGKLTLDLNGKWCKWSKKKCRLQLDLFVPTRYNSSTYTVGAPGPYFCWVKRKDLKDKKITPPDNPLITVPWQYESTMHGDEWKYLWHGKHHKDGDEITTTVSSTITSSVKFKEEDGTETTLTPSNTISTQIKTKLIDVPLGGTWTYFCDPILVNNFKGTRYYLGLMDFYVRETN
nr:hypothetical protein [Saprospiraceae bacterium]